MTTNNFKKDPKSILPGSGIQDQQLMIWTQNMMWNFAEGETGAADFGTGEGSSLNFRNFGGRSFGSVPMDEQGSCYWLELGQTYNSNLAAVLRTAPNSKLIAVRVVGSAVKSPSQRHKRGSLLKSG